MSLYYSDDYVTLYHGDSLEILPTLELKADVLLTDPPYFKVKQDEWDNQWDKAGEFLAWMGDFLDVTKPLLTSQASVWVFASPAMTSSVERLVSERFRVLNSIRWVKEAGWHQKAELASLRSYLTPWEGVVFAEQKEDVYAVESEALRRRVFKSLGQYFTQAAMNRGRPGSSISIEMGYDSAMFRRWEEGSSVPTLAAYHRMREVLGKEELHLSYTELCDWNAALLEQFEKAREPLKELRRPFRVDQRSASTDLWAFRPVSPFPGKHPCEKPQSMLRHMIETSSRPDELILDPFAGSGSTLIAASHAGRNAVGIEKDERWCEHAANRLSQGALDIFGIGESA